MTALERLSTGYYNTGDHNPAANPGGLGGDGHRYAMVPPRPPMVAAAPVMLADIAAVAGGAATAADTATAAAAVAAAVAANIDDLLTRLFMQAGDPGAVGAGKIWVDQGAGTLKIRNADNTVWQPIILPSAATETVAGILRLASLGQAVAGTATDIAVAPAGIKAAIAALTPGGANTQAMSADLVLTATSPRLQRLAPNTAGRSVLAPDATTMPLGGPAFIVHNNSVYPLHLRASDGLALAELQPDQIAIVSLHANGTAQGGWLVDVRARWSGSVFSPRQALTTSTAFNVKLSKVPTANKALLSYASGSHLCVRVLTLVGRSITVGAEQQLTAIDGVARGCAVAVSNTAGLAVYETGGDLYHRRFSIDLSSGVCALTGSAVAWSLSGGDYKDVRIDPVPGSTTHAIALARYNDGVGCRVRLIRDDGASTSASSVLSTPLSGDSARHDIVALSATQALQVYGSGSNSYGQTITMNLGALTLATGSSTSAAGTMHDVRASRISSTAAMAIYQQSASLAVGRIMADGAAGLEVPVSDGSTGFPGAALMWTEAAGCFVFADGMGSGNQQLCAVDFAIVGGGTILDRSRKRVLNASAGLATSSHRADAIALSGSVGLVVFGDAGNSSYLTAIVIERGA